MKAGCTLTLQGRPTLLELKRTIEAFELQNVPHYAEIRVHTYDDQRESGPPMTTIRAEWETTTTP